MTRAKYRPGFRHSHLYAADSEAVNRPVRMPEPGEYRVAVARDLARGWAGVNEAKVRAIAWVPLMDVALDGVEGMDVALARDWSRVA